MRRYTYRALCLTLVYCLSVGCSSGTTVPKIMTTVPEIILDTTKLAQRTVEQVVSLRGLQPQEGPQIERRLPEKTVFRSDEPVKVCLDFNPAADGVEADMTTLKVEVLTLKGWYGKDITDQAKGGIEGTAICLSVDFQGHTGSIQFLVSIKDEKGRLSEERIDVTLEAAELAS